VNSGEAVRRGDGNGIGSSALDPPLIGRVALDELIVRP
jgi:hypothetical protein